MHKIAGKGINRKYYLMLLLLTLAAYWPLTFNVFGLKNDALIYFLPFRYHVSEAIQNGEFPWWSPYLYSGLPLHSDMQSGVWNPVVMLISCFTNYNMSVLQWELLFYLFIAAVGMYQLAKEFGSSPQSSFLAAVVYLCCGYMTDSGSFIPWISNAAYLPFVFCYFYRLLKHPSLFTSLQFAFFLILLFTTGYPSFFLFAGYIMLAGFIVLHVQEWKNKRHLQSVWKYGAIAIAFFLLVCSPALFSWLDFFDYYDRGKGASLERVLLDSFPPFSSLSYVFPSAVYKEHPWLDTDVSVRNASVGIFFLLFFLIALQQRKEGVRKFILAATIFSFLFSLGNATPVREWCYNYIPLMNTFRHPSCMRLFTTIGILLIALPFLDNLLTGASAALKSTRRIAIGLSIVVTGFIFYYLFQSNLVKPFNFSLTKEWMDKLNFADLVVLQGIVQLLFLFSLIGILWKSKLQWLPVLMITHAILFCWTALPFTFISQVKTAVMNKHLASFPRGFPLPDLAAPVDVEASAYTTSASPLGYDNFYNKKPEIQDNIISPTVNSRYHEFLLTEKLRTKLNKYPFIYFSDSIVYTVNALPDSGRFVYLESTLRLKTQSGHKSDTIKVKSLSANSIRLEVAVNKDGLLTIFQQYHHGWRAWLNNTEIPVYRSNIAFMSVMIPAGNHAITMKFEPAAIVQISLYISIITLLLMVLLFILLIARKRRYS